MQSSFLKGIGKIIIILVVLGVVVFSFFFIKNWLNLRSADLSNINSGLKVTTIGISVEGRKIEAYTLGSGEKHLLFVGGIHGGYEWNSVLLAYKFLDYLEANPKIVSEDITISVIPSMNPDGVFKVVGKEGRFLATDISTSTTNGLGRLNADQVDLNRNFGCKWEPVGTWRGNNVSAGTAPFSEPEALALKNYVSLYKPKAVIFWHSQSNAVYASECEAGILPETLNIMNAYSLASGYKAIKSFDSYKVTGDAEGWLASIKIPAITVELQTHETIEWERNLAGVKAIIDYYKGVSKL